MKTTNLILSLLFVATAAGVGCGSAKEFQIQVGEDTPVDSAITPEATPEEMAPPPSSDAADADVLPENPDSNTDEAPVDILKRPGDLSAYGKELKAAPEGRQYGIADLTGPTAAEKYDDRYSIVMTQPAQTGPQNEKYVLMPVQRETVLQHIVDERVPMKSISQETQPCTSPDEVRDDNGVCVPSN